MDQVEAELRRGLGKAEAETKIKREEYISALRDAFENPKEAQENVRWALENWGARKTISCLENQPSRFGQPRGSILTLDRFKPGGAARAATAEQALENLPAIARDLMDAEVREQHARNAYDSHCQERGLEPHPSIAPKRRY